MNSLKTYSPQRVQLAWGGIDISGYADGTFIEASRNVDNTTATVGAAGDVGLTFMPDKTGVVEITLMQTAESNRLLSAVQLAQDNTGNIIRADLTVVDPSGGFLVYAKACHIMTPATVTLADDQESKTWTLYSEDLQYSDVPAGFVASADVLARISSGVSGIQAISDALQDAIS